MSLTKPIELSDDEDDTEDGNEEQGCCDHNIGENDSYTDFEFSFESTKPKGEQEVDLEVEVDDEAEIDPEVGSKSESDAEAEAEFDATQPIQVGEEDLHDVKVEVEKEGKDKKIRKDYADLVEDDFMPE